MQKFAFTILFTFSVFLSGQTAEEIIHQNLELSGGTKNWRNLNSIILYGDAFLSLEESFPMVIYHQRPYQKKVVFLVDGKELLNEGYDGNKGWTYNEISAKNEVVPHYLPDSFDSDILDFAKKGFEAHYLGQEQFEQKTCYKIELIKNTNRTTYCFSTENYSLLWEENKDEKLIYSDYKTFNGLRFATKVIGQPKAGGEYVLKFNSIQINPKIDEKHFRF